MHWRERYSYEAKRQDEALLKLTERQLVERIQKNMMGPYFSIWRVIRKKGTIQYAAITLWEFLQRKPGKVNMLNRYHCAGALFKILGLNKKVGSDELRKRVQWDHQGEKARQEALQELRELIDERLDRSGV